MHTHRSNEIVFTCRLASLTRKEKELALREQQLQDREGATKNAARYDNFTTIYAVYYVHHPSLYLHTTAQLCKLYIKTYFLTPHINSQGKYQERQHQP